MQALEVLLPGGLVVDEHIERIVRFQQVTGSLEQSLIELNWNKDRVRYVTAVLELAVESIGEHGASTKLLAQLCIADRQYLMLHLASLLGGDMMWLNVTCQFCNQLFDINIKRSELPVKEASSNYPLAKIKIKDWTIDARIPTGEDQDAISKEPDSTVLLMLLKRCIHTVNGADPDPEFCHRLTDYDIEQIDDALDEASPAVCNQLVITCPECKRQQYTVLDHYLLPDMSGYTLYDEIHTLACHYHWSERDILDLPRSRRQLYLDRISRSAGLH